MANVYLDDTILTGIANQTRRLAETQTTYKPSEMVTALSNVEKGTTPTGTISITTNGTTDVTNYASANVNVQPDMSNYYIQNIGSENSVGDGMIAFCKTIKKLPPFTATSSNHYLNYVFSRLTSLIETPEITNIETVKQMTGTFRGCTSLTTVKNYNFRDMMYLTDTFYGCSALVTFPNWDTSSVYNFGNIFNGCTSLANVPVLSFANASYLANMFSNCPSLTNQSIDNILQSCIGAVAYTNTKTLARLGLTSTDYPAATIQALPHYQDFVNAGWSIGY